MPRAFAVPDRPGRILVTSAMLGALEPAERRVLLTHGRALAPTDGLTLVLLTADPAGDLAGLLSGGLN
ncbi:hypothetical protein ABZ079_27115 [Streptomyces sp. NPDC006314]|uniref:hypothetical protein n=1 Tax=Streptomyces sp. NPDC006314 TaxID=3154475 RepID=UPI0033B7C798